MYFYSVCLLPLLPVASDCCCCKLCRSALRIQKRVRIWIARRVVRRRRLRHYKAIVIQTKMRMCLAKALVQRVREKMQADLDRTAAIIQKNARRLLAIAEVNKLRAKAEEERRRLRQLEFDEDSQSHVSGETGATLMEESVSAWLPTYGVDPEYRLKRNRRITERLFKKLLHTRHVRLLTRFGVVFMDAYPPRKTEEEVLDELQGAASGEEPDVKRDDFVSVFLPPFDPVRTHRAEALELFRKAPFTAVLHLPTSVEMRASVDYNIITLQCFQRQRLARKERDKMLAVHKAIALFQRIFRRRYERFHTASVRIISIFRMLHAKRRTAVLQKERRSAMCIQNSYRCYLARSAWFNLRCVEKLSVLKSSPESVDLHGPEKALEHREDTFWIARSNERAEIRVEFGRVETVTEVWIQTSMFFSSPCYVSILSVPRGERAYQEIVDRSDLPPLKGHRWHKFAIPVTTTKYMKLVFLDNYGDEEHIALRQIRFLRSIERKNKATI